MMCVVSTDKLTLQCEQVLANNSLPDSSTKLHRHRNSCVSQKRPSFLSGFELKQND